MKQKTEKKGLILFLTMIFMLLPMGMKAQSPMKNVAFKSGEILTYNMYYNWQFVWVKAGTASMSVVESTRQGKPAYRCSLTTRGNGKLDNFFVLRDTLLCYTTRDLIPLYFRKGAREGSRYYVDELFYSYPQGQVQCNTKELAADGKRYSHTFKSKENLYDMMSIFLRARNIDTSNMKKGHKVPFSIADGNGVKRAYLLYRGNETVKADDGKKYDCLKISYFECEKGEKDKEIVCFYVTNDRQHIPVRLDLFLKFGSAKAFLVGKK